MNAPNRRVGAVMRRVEDPRGRRTTYWRLIRETRDHYGQVIEYIPARPNPIEATI